MLQRSAMGRGSYGGGRGGSSRSGLGTALAPRNGGSRDRGAKISLPPESLPKKIAAPKKSPPKSTCVLWAAGGKGHKWFAELLRSAPRRVSRANASRNPGRLMSLACVFACSRARRPWLVPSPAWDEEVKDVQTLKRADKAMDGRNFSNLGRPKERPTDGRQPVSVGDDAERAGPLRRSAQSRRGRGSER
jgi:hypothetical protein